MAINPQFFSLALLILLFAGTAHVSSDSECEYTLKVQTGSVANAGTDSIISVTLTDVHEDSFEIKDLAQWGTLGSSFDYFEIGKKETFKGRGGCTGLPVCKISVDSDGSGILPDWFLEDIEVEVVRPDERPNNEIFNFQQWIPPQGGVELSNC
ncbi:PLAT domain-containing protein 1-like [Henckelia pumila]|uniref:PLAT domain-containing protein 1-like n=1 Tax=Henckelia pumila TaxID=405737 RepID=UPI003C6DE6B3